MVNPEHTCRAISVASPIMRIPPFFPKLISNASQLGVVIVRNEMQGGEYVLDPEHECWPTVKKTRRDLDFLAFASAPLVQQEMVLDRTCGRGRRRHVKD